MTTMRMEKYKGVEVYVNNATGLFSTEERALEASSLPELRKLIDKDLKRKRKDGFQPISVFLVDYNFEDDADEETILGISGTSGDLRIKSGGTYSSWGGILVFLPKEFPHALIQELENKRKDLAELEDEIRKIARYRVHRQGRIDGAQVIELEKQLSEALTGERKEEDADADVE